MHYRDEQKKSKLQRKRKKYERTRICRLLKVRQNHLLSSVIFSFLFRFLHHLSRHHFHKVTFTAIFFSVEWCVVNGFNGPDMISRCVSERSWAEISCCELDLFVNPTFGNAEVFAVKSLKIYLKSKDSSLRVRRCSNYRRRRGEHKTKDVFTNMSSLVLIYFFAKGLKHILMSEHRKDGRIHTQAQNIKWGWNEKNIITKNLYISHPYQNLWNGF